MDIVKRVVPVLLRDQRWGRGERMEKILQGTQICNEIESKIEPYEKIPSDMEAHVADDEME